ncbi:MAG: hypothetical protein HOK54_09620 [Alphaproteobacteria bacterium]|jgi:hypothetical protein|nr:hypothetical protein [Alphaproteobacteria bacterium]
MSSNVYLFDPSTVSANSDDKPLIQILREAELARSRESAKIIYNAYKRIAGLFRAKQTVAKAPAKAATKDEPRLAA